MTDACSTKRKGTSGSAARRHVSNVLMIGTAVLSDTDVLHRCHAEMESMLAFHRTRQSRLGVVTAPVSTGFIMPPSPGSSHLSVAKSLVQLLPK